MEHWQESDSDILTLRHFDGALARFRAELDEFELRLSLGPDVRLRCPSALLPTSQELRELVRRSIEQKLPAVRAELLKSAREEAASFLKEIED